MFMIIQYSKGNTLFYVRNKYKEPINSKVVAISSENYKNKLLIQIKIILEQTNSKLENLRFILLEMNDIEDLNVNAVCELSRYLKLHIINNVIVTNNIETFDYDEYLDT